MILTQLLYKNSLNKKIVQAVLVYLAIPLYSRYLDNVRQVNNKMILIKEALLDSILVSYHLLNLAYCFGGIKTLRAGSSAVHYGVAAIELEWIF